MRTTDINVQIFDGDFVIDNMDSSVREISEIRDHGDDTASVHMVDGGVMALSEIRIDDIRLESEINDRVPAPSGELKEQDAGAFWDRQQNEDCKHGHGYCALVPGGNCSDEMERARGGSTH